MLLEGLHLPLTTPLYPDGRLNPRKLERNVERYSKTPASGLVALGEQGEATLLSDEEARTVLRSVAEAAAAEKVLVAGVSRDSVTGTLDLCDVAAGAGYDVVLARASAAARNLREMLAYFEAVADRSPLPVLMLSGAERPVPMEAVIELGLHPGVLGLVDEGGGGRIEAIRAGTAAVKREVSVTPVFAPVTGRMLGRQQVDGVVSVASLTGGPALKGATAPHGLRTRMKAVGFQILAGRTEQMLAGLRCGAVGTMPGFAACAPQACYEVLAAWKDADEGLADEKQVRLLQVARRIEDELGIPGIKYGCDLNGYFGGIARLPRLPLTGAERNEIEALMQGLRN